MNDRWVIVGATAEQVREQFRPGVNTQSGTSYTLVASDENKIILCTNAAAVTVTVPNDTDASLPIGFITHVHQKGAGQVTLAAGSGVTLLYSSSSKTRARYSSVSVIKIGANEYSVVGDTE